MVGRLESTIFVSGAISGSRKAVGGTCGVRYLDAATGGDTCSCLSSGTTERHLRVLNCRARVDTKEQIT